MSTAQKKVTQNFSANLNGRDHLEDLSKMGDNSNMILKLEV
jgi:hypothetical protein